jgi:hypothetical protein
VERTKLLVVSGTLEPFKQGGRRSLGGDDHPILAIAAPPPVMLSIPYDWLVGDTHSERATEF